MEEGKGIKQYRLRAGCTPPGNLADFPEVGAYQLGQNSWEMIQEPDGGVSEAKPGNFVIIFPGGYKLVAPEHAFHDYYEPAGGE